jgi:hypothetical protein
VLFREAQQTPRSTTLHLQRIILDDRGCRTQLFTENLNDLEERLRMRHESWQQVSRVDCEDFAWFEGNRICGTPLAVQSGNLTVEIAGPEKIQHDLLSIGRCVHDFGAPRQHNHQTIAWVTTPTHDFILGKTPRVASADQPIECSVRQAPKEGIGSQEWSNSRGKFE